MAEALEGARAWARPPDLTKLDTFGWAWDEQYTVDENLLDLACLLARNSVAKDGHMGCVLVRGVAVGRGGERGSGSALHIGLAPTADGGRDGERPVTPTIVMQSVNAPLFGARRSDLHAEALAVCESARLGIATAGLSCYVTRAPCTNCYKMLATAGVCRIVTPNKALASDDCTASARHLGIEYVWVPDTAERAAAREGIAAQNTDYERVRALRQERKRMRQEGKYGRKAIRAAEGASPASGVGEEGDEGAEAALR